jgi:hypothetical protein
MQLIPLNQQTGGQQYSDTFPFSIPWFVIDKVSSCPNLARKPRTWPSGAQFVAPPKKDRPIQGILQGEVSVYH